MMAWLVSQYCAQKIWYAPAWSAGNHNVTSRHNVHLGYGRQARKVMDNVFRKSSGFTGRPIKYMEFVHSPSDHSVKLQLPHPLLTHDINFHRVVGHARHAEVVTLVDHTNKPMAMISE